MILLSLSLTFIILVLILLFIKLYVLKKAIKEITNSLDNILSIDTNNIITISSNDKDVKYLTSCLNKELKKLRKQRIEYETGNRELKNIITNVSHDMRTPLTAIIGYVDLIKDEKEIDIKKDYIKIIERKANELKELTDNLFDFSKAVDIKENMNREKCNLNEILEESLIEFYSIFKSKNIEPSINICKEKVYRNVDKILIKRIFENILSNICKYSEGDFKVNLYRDGKISGYIKQGTAEDLEMQKEVATRNWDPNCYFTEIWVSNNVCEGFVYNDPEYGLGFGSECTDMGHYETVQVCDEEIPSTGENGDSWQPPTGGGGGNSNNGGYNEPIEAPKAQKIFRNSQFTKEQWETVEQILNEMCTTDIGDALYKILLEKLKGGTVIIKFWQEKGSQLDFADKPTTITLGTKQNNGELLHELVHLLQAYTVGSDWNKTGLNREIEAHYIQELYIESYSEDKRIEWETDTRLDARWKITRKLFKYINPLTGGLQQGVTEADLKDFLEHDVIAAFREVGYSSYDYVYQIRESSLANFQHLINLLEYKNRHY